MRIAIALIFLGFVAIHQAAPQPAPITGLGPYHFDMSEVQAAAIDPAGGLKPEIVPDRYSAPLLQIFGHTYEVALGFERNRLREIEIHRAVSTQAEGCEVEYKSDLAALEQQFGPLAGPAGPWEGAGLPREKSKTPAGSEIRRYEEPRSHVLRYIASMPEPYTVEEWAYFDTLDSCILMTMVRNDFVVPLSYAGFSTPPTPAEMAQAPLAGGNTWARRPTVEEMMDFFPPFAVDHGIPGRVVLDCLINADQTLRCAVSEEMPLNMGFGVAALKAARVFRIAADSNGTSTAGRHLRIPIRFDPPRSFF